MATIALVPLLLLPVAMQTLTPLLFLKRWMYLDPAHQFPPTTAAAAVVAVRRCGKLNTSSSNSNYSSCYSLPALRQAL
jgi:hypothetical protein